MQIITYDFDDFISDPDSEAESDEGILEDQ